MSLKTLLAAATLAAGLAVSAGTASAAAPAPLTVLKELAGAGSPVAQVQYRSCRRVRFQCAGRFPRRGWRFQRCMRRRGC